MGPSLREEPPNLQEEFIGSAVSQPQLPVEAPGATGLRSRCL